MKDSTAYLITDMLLDCSHNGTGKKLGSLNIDVASKTGTVGTADGNSNIWNVSYTPQNVICSLISSSDDQSTINCSYTGSNYPTMMIKDLLVGTNNIPFKKPSSVQSVGIDKLNLKENNKLTLATSLTPPKFVVNEYFASDNLPLTYSEIFTNIDNVEYAIKIENNVPTISFDAKKTFKLRHIQKK